MVLFCLKMVLRCCVPRCQNKGRFGFHKFPRDEEHCLKWQYVSRKRNISTKYLPYSAYRVCEKHFKADDYNFRFGKKRLNKIAIPNVYVPEMESVYEEHSYVISINGGKETLTDVVSIYTDRKINVCLVSMLIVLFCPFFDWC